MKQTTDDNGSIWLTCDELAEAIVIPGDMVRMVKDHLNHLDDQAITNLEQMAREHPRTGVI